MEWGTFADTSALVLSLPDGCLAATFNVSAAYRTTPVAPTQQNVLCVLWMGLLYVDFALAFRLASSAGIFGWVVDMIVAIYIVLGFGPMLKWVDDFFVIRLPGQVWTEEDFLAFGNTLGVPWSRQKLRRFATKQRYIRYIWDLEAQSVALPQDKLYAVQGLLAAWAVPITCWSAKDAVRLHGKLVHLSLVFPLISPPHLVLQPRSHPLTRTASHQTRSPPILTGSATSCSCFCTHSHSLAQNLSTSAGGATRVRPLVSVLSSGATGTSGNTRLVLGSAQASLVTLAGLRP
jgi:hypothetical protein